MADVREHPEAKRLVAERVRELLADGRYPGRKELKRALPPTRCSVDTVALPDALARKIAAREALLGGALSPLAARYRRDPAVDLWRSTRLLRCLEVAAFPVGLLLLGSVAFSSREFGALLPVVVLVWLAPLLLERVVDWRSERGPLSLNEAELNRVRQHTKIVAPKDLPRTVTSYPDALQVAAAEIVAAIRMNRAWMSEHTELHRIRLDLNEEAYQITESCANLAALATTITDAEQDSPRATVHRELAATIEEYKTLYDQASDAVLDRVASLQQYEYELQQIESLLDDIDNSTRLIAASEDFAATFTAVVRDHDAASQIQALTDELVDLRARLETELTFITDHVISAPFLVAPLALAERTGRT